MIRSDLPAALARAYPPPTFVVIDGGASWQRCDLGEAAVVVGDTVQLDWQDDPGAGRAGRGRRSAWGGAGVRPTLPAVPQRSGRRLDRAGAVGGLRSAAPGRGACRGGHHRRDRRGTRRRLCPGRCRPHRGSHPARWPATTPITCSSSTPAPTASSSSTWSSVDCCGEPWCRPARATSPGTTDGSTACRARPAGGHYRRSRCETAAVRAVWDRR